MLILFILYLVFDSFFRYLDDNKRRKYTVVVACEEIEIIKKIKKI